MNSTHDSNTLSSMVERRNSKLKILFSQLGDNFRIIGNPNNPAVIMNEDTVLSVWTHNFRVNFHDLPFKGNLLFSIKLTGNDQYYEEDFNKIKSWLSNPSFHRPAYKIINICDRCKSDFVYLTGYNFEDSKQKTGRYPVFSKKCPKIYFSRENAMEVMQELKLDGYNVYVTH